ncbi:MAG TPA: sugar transferase [Bacteroidales bacterium]|nr:sugar transferase [Bacteroidales bacterium]HQK68431.1 sugar transferase [Bacteroidales bacterium]
MYRRYFKRLFDLLLSLSVLVVISPVLLLIGTLILIKIGRPVIFSQERPGRNGLLFRIYKFRSMTDTRDQNGQLLADYKRMTKFGEFLRKYSLDELPELINVLKGNMSLIGPRPLLKEYLPIYNEEQARRHEVLPGITGWAQINGRNAITWEEKFKLDVYYVDNVSFFLDIKIMALTLYKVIKKEGINSGINETMPMFRGSVNNSIIDDI